MAPVLSIKPKETIAVLIGASKFRKNSGLPSLPSVERNVRELKKIFVNESIIGILENNIIPILNEPKVSVLTKLNAACDNAIDSLIVYYAGHGIIGKNSSRLHLATSESTDANPEIDAIEFQEMKEIIKRSVARKKILIVDSCFSGRIIDRLSTPSSVIQDNINIEGVCSIASVPQNRLALGPRNEKYTIFTGALIKTLKDGIDNDREGISIEELYKQIQVEFIIRNKGKKPKDPEIPRPQIAGVNEGRDIVIAKNRKYSKVSSMGKPLTGIVEILYYCHSLLNNSRIPGCSIWFAGLTAAFGPVHNIPRVRDNWQNKYPGDIGFDRVSEEFNQNLLAILAGAGERAKIVIVTLKKELIMPKFVKPLYTKWEYVKSLQRNPWHLNLVESEITKFQGQVEDAAKLHGHVIKYVEDMPHQTIVTQLGRGSKQIRSIDIQVGTGNIGSKLAQGSYCEDSDECEKLKVYVDDLYNSALK